MACPATGADVRPPAIGAAEKQGFDQWLEQVLGSEREVVLAQFQQLISKHLELHHAELIAQVEKQLAMPRSHDLEEIAEDVPQERAGHEAGRWPDTGMQMESKIHAKYGPSKDLASDVKWSRFASSDSSDIQENIASLLPGGGIPSAGFQTANQETDTSIPPSCNAEVDKAPLNKSCPRLPMEMKAKFPSEWADRSPCQKSPYSNEYKSPLRQKLMYRSHRLAAVASQGIEVMEGADFLLRFVNSTWFELVIVLVILLNGVTIALEAQYVGCNVGHTLGYPKYNTSASEEFPWIESTLNVAQIIFNVLFLIELFLRIGAYRLYLCKHPLLVCDMLLILVSGADVVAAGLFLGMNPAAIRCIRLLKLLRMVKILRSISWMNSLFLIIRSMTACVNALLWSLMLLALLQTCVGLGLLQVLHNYLEDTSRDLESRKLVFEYFGTFSRTFVTMYEVSVGNWAPVCRTLMEEVSEWFGLFFILYSCTLCFAVVNVLRAVFIAETGRISASDDQIAVMRKEQNKEMIAQKLKVIFEELDESGDGFVNQREFKQLADTVVRKYLSTLDVDVDDVKQLFKILDDGDGNISCEEFCHGILMVKGQAKAIDMIKVAKCVRRIENKVDMAIASQFRSNAC